MTIFKELQAKGITPKEGDEAVWCGAAYRSLLAGKPVRAANAYIFRYWLGGHFYYVSTNYTLDPVCILHLPGAAKDRQLKLIYNGYARRGVLPAAEQKSTACAACPPHIRRCCAPYGRGCWPSCKELPCPEEKTI